MPARCRICRCMWFVAFCAAMGMILPAASGLRAEQIRLARVEQFPPLAADWQLLDWRKRTESFLDAVLDPTAKGDYLPLMWWDDTKVLVGEVGELLVTARRKGKAWYLGGMSAKRAR